MKTIPSVLIAVLALGISGCGRSSNPEPGSSSTSPVTRSGPVSMNKADYPVFPDADAGADPSVPAEQGGKGFTGKGWETNTDFDLIGDPRAIKGGVFRDYVPDFPGTLRLVGPESNSQFNYGITAMAYETLLGVHPTTLEFVPGLATHWQISPDKMTYRFRIDPNARFSDGVPVTSEDVVATYDFLLDKTLQDPMEQITYSKLSRPVAESKYIVRVQAKELNWRNFLYFSGMQIFPAHVLKSVNGDKYLKEYNYKLLPGSGPYTIREEDISKGQTITVRRRKDYWAEKARENVGLGNFDEMQFVVVRDDNLAFEKFKKGELDTYEVRQPRQWVEELNFENVQRGLIQKRKVYNSQPQEIREFAFNARKPPFDDIRVRKALTLLLDRKLIIEKILFNEFEAENSFYTGTPYENPTNPKNDYDPQMALKLLADAGWNSRDNQGRLVKNGAPLQIELLYRNKINEPELTVYQEDLRKVGISLTLRLLTFETEIQMVDQRKFQMAHLAWGGLLFPNPETEWQSTLADVDNTNNVTGFKSARVDELCKLYDKSFDTQERIRIIREIDGIVANSYNYVLHWTAPFTRIAFWNKFGAPPGYLTRTGDTYTAHQLWWVDPDKDAKLKRALGDSSVKLEVGQTDDHYWDEYAKAHPPAK
ncbi:MAG: extracellular solute-binding protein [Candidatus Acidiferrales bacterium]